MITHKKIQKIVNYSCIILMMGILFLATADEVFYEKSAKYYTLILFFSLFGFLFSNVNVLDKIKQKDLSTWLVAISGILVPILLFSVESRWGAMFSAWNILLVFYLADKIEVKAKALYPIYGMQVIILIVFLLTYPKTYNPNHCGMYLLVMYIVATIVVAKLKEMKPIKYLYSIIHILLISVVVYEILLYRARTSLVGLLFFELCWFLFIKGFGKRKWFSYCLIFGVTIGDLIFTAIYMNLYQFIGDAKMPFFNKRIMSGRQYSWADFWNGFLAKPVTGIGSNFEKTIPNWSGLEAHNALLSLMAVHGIIIFAVMLYLIFRYLKNRTLDMKITSLNAILVAGIFTIFIISVFENALAAGQYTTLLLLFAITYNANNLKKNQENQENIEV